MWKLLTAALGTALFLVSLAFTGAGAAEDPPGKKAFLKNKCQKCHTIEAVGVVKSEDEDEEEDEDEWDDEEDDVDPPDLSGAGKERDAAWLTKWLKKKVKTKEGRKHKKKFKGSDDELKAITAWLVTLKFDVSEKKPTEK